MRNLSDTISRLAYLRSLADGPADQTNDLADFAFAGSNPGALLAKTFLPEGLAKGAPLVVVLHGCTQTAGVYDLGAGWSALARQAGFALLLPEQRRANNLNLCFNWYQPEDARRDSGEVLSIRQMIAAMVAEHAIDPRRIFVTGLSAGGAMTAALLAAYPEVFAGGAIIAGMPSGSAVSLPQAFDRMRGHGGPSKADLASGTLAISAHQGSWPILSVWHGSADAIVSPENMEIIVDQWRRIHGLAAEPTRTETINGHSRRLWCGPDGAERIEAFSIAGMGHGTPIDPHAAGGVGMRGAHMLEAGISSTHRIASFWGITPDGRRARLAHRRRRASRARIVKARVPNRRALARAVTRRTTVRPVTVRPATVRPAPPVQEVEASIAARLGGIIRESLRAAGLIR